MKKNLNKLGLLALLGIMVSCGGGTTSQNPSTSSNGDTSSTTTSNATTSNATTSEATTSSAGTTSETTTSSENSTSETEDLTPTHAGTVEDPYTVEDAIKVAKKAGTNETSDAYYIKGVISELTEASTSFGNATFKIVDEGKSDAFLCYRVLYLNNKKYTEVDPKISVGDTVVVLSKIVNFKGNTPETCDGAYIYEHIVANPIEVTKVTADAEISVETGKSKNITTSVEPTNATYKALTFTSENEQIATVDEDGVVTGVAAGETKVIVASSKYSTIKAEVKIVVTKGEEIQKGDVLFASVFGKDTITGSFNNGYSVVQDFTIADENGNAMDFNGYGYAKQDSCYRLGGKKGFDNINESNNVGGYFQTGKAFAYEISKITFNILKKDSTLTNFKVYVYDGILDKATANPSAVENWLDIVTISASSITAGGTLDITPSEGVTWKSGVTFRFAVNKTGTSKNNGLDITGLSFTY